MKDQVSLLLHLLATSYERKAWHGPNLRGSLRGVSVAEAAWRPGQTRHNIWEHAVHAAYWKYAVCRKLTGAKRGSFHHKGSNWFERHAALGEQAWLDDLALLRRVHGELVKAVEELIDKDLQRNPKGSTYSRWQLIAGIAAHDVYHAGQVQLLKRLYRPIG
jgi:uncharacterized damage-inducible protein DinB